MDTSSFGLFDQADAVIVPGAGLVDPLGFDLSRLLVGGVFHGRCYDRAGDLRWEDDAPNGVTSAGLDLVLNNVFRGVAQLASFFVGIIDNNGWTGFNLSDTMAAHSAPNAWAEVDPGSYSNSVRPTWSPAAPVGNAIVNAATMDFLITASVVVKGLFLVGGAAGTADVKGGTGGTLFSTASFSGGTKTCSPGDTLKVTYTMSAANSASNT